MIKFGTGGWRAIIGDEFTKANVQLLTAGLCTLMKKQGVSSQGVCVGYDRRFLSKQSSQWASEVFAGYGIPCLLLVREAPTPLIMFTVKERLLPYGMAITASHNPALYNGIKLFIEGGADAPEELTCALEAELAQIEGAEIPTIPFESALEQGKVTLINPFNEYIDSILRRIDVQAIKNAQLRVALDPMFGVSKTSLQTILLTCRCEVDVIHERHDTLFGGRLPSPTAGTLKLLSNFVVENGCSLGIATDGDADRVGIIDANGEFIHPNIILVLLYYYLLKYRGLQGAVVRNLSTTHMLDKVAESFGEKCYEVPVGFKHISLKMQETGALIGGEASGGLTVCGHLPGKDGIYAASLLVEMAAVTNRPLLETYRELEAQFGRLYFEEEDFPINAQRAKGLSKLLFEEKALPEFGTVIKSVSYLDGCKVTFANGGFAVVRFSGTEPLVRICAEMPKKRETKNCIDAFKALMGL